MNDPAPTSRDARFQAICRDILEHFRNLLFIAMLLALGLVARRRSADLVGAPLLEDVIGWGVIAVAVVLALVNLWLGASKLKQWRHWRLWSSVLLVTYVLIALRVMEVMALVQLGRK